MDGTLALILFSMVHILQACDQCDCVVSDYGTNKRGVQVVSLGCQEGSVTWYNPYGALRLDMKPKDMDHFQACFVVDSGKAKLKISQEVDTGVNSKSPQARSEYVLNDHNLHKLVTTVGKSAEFCVTSTKPVVLYLEPEPAHNLGYQKIILQYDVVPKKDNVNTFIEDCRPCSEAEVLKAYCSSDFVVVGSMEAVHNAHKTDTTFIDVAVSQIIRQKGSHFERQRRDSPTLQGIISTPKKCGVVKGEGLFLMTGRVRLGKLRMGCAPYLGEWEAIVSRAAAEGRLECSRD